MIVERNHFTARGRPAPSGLQRTSSRVIVVGATGTIDTAVVAALTSRHDVVKVGHYGGDFQVDLASPDSITGLFRAIGSFDAPVCIAGVAKFASLDELVVADYQFGLSKSNL